MLHHISYPFALSVALSFLLSLNDAALVTKHAQIVKWRVQ